MLPPVVWNVQLSEVKNSPFATELPVRLERVILPSAVETVLSRVPLRKSDWVVCSQLWFVKVRLASWFERSTFEVV